MLFVLSVQPEQPHSMFEPEQPHSMFVVPIGDLQLEEGRPRSSRTARKQSQELGGATPAAKGGRAGVCLRKTQKTTGETEQEKENIMMLRGDAHQQRRPCSSRPGPPAQ